MNVYLLVAENDSIHELPGNSLQVVIGGELLLKPARQVTHLHGDCLQRLKQQTQVSPQPSVYTTGNQKVNVSH